MRTLTITAHAPMVALEGFGPSRRVVDATNGRTIGHADIIRGFAHYVGTKGAAHEGVSAVVSGGSDGLVAALAQGLKSGRDDRADA